MNESFIAIVHVECPSTEYQVCFLRWPTCPCPEHVVTPVRIRLLNRIPLALASPIVLVPVSSSTLLMSSS